MEDQTHQKKRGVPSSNHRQQAPSQPEPKHATASNGDAQQSSQQPQIGSDTLPSMAETDDLAEGLNRALTEDEEQRIAADMQEAARQQAAAGIKPPELQFELRRLHAAVLTQKVPCPVRRGLVGCRLEKAGLDRKGQAWPRQIGQQPGVMRPPRTWDARAHMALPTQPQVHAGQLHTCRQLVCMLCVLSHCSMLVQVFLTACLSCTHGHAHAHESMHVVSALAACRRCNPSWTPTWPRAAPSSTPAPRLPLQRPWLVPSGADICRHACL